MRLLVLPLVQSHTPPRLHQRCLYRCVCGLQPVSEGGVLWTSELGATGELLEVALKGVLQTKAGLAA